MVWKTRGLELPVAERVPSRAILNGRAFMGTWKNLLVPMHWTFVWKTMGRDMERDKCGGCATRKQASSGVGGELGS